MKFLRTFFINLVILILVVLSIEFIMPGLLSGLYQIGMGVLGPGLLILLVIVTALGVRQKRR